MARDRRRSRARRCVGERQARRAASRCPRRLVVDGRRPSRNCRANTTLNEAEARLSADLGHRKIRLVCSGDVHLLKVSALRSPSLSDPLDSTRLRDNPGARPNVPRTRLRERTTRARDLQHMGAQPLVATTLARSASPCSARDWCGARCPRAGVHCGSERWFELDASLHAKAQAMAKVACGHAPSFPRTVGAAGGCRRVRMACCRAC